MHANLVVKFERDTDTSQLTLAEFKFQPTSPGRFSSMGVGPAEVRLPNGGTLVITSTWDPKSNMINLLVLKGDRIIGHAGSCWHLGDPYFGVQVGDIGFLHIYTEREREPGS
jgi:hypothetical protein